MIRGLALLAAVSLVAGAAHAQTKVDGDPYEGDPVGIVENPCPDHPKPTDQNGWHMWNLHMLTRDFGQICRYHAANAALKASGTPVRVVFMGDSITDNWIGKDASLFAGGLVDRGISGQTTSQMVVRFREDVIALKPKAVHIMAATNDVAGNTGAATMETVQGNIRTMAELARAHGIQVILASVPPAAAFPWSPEKKPAPTIIALNRWLRAYAAENGFAYVDYHAALADANGGMKPGLSSDGVHPVEAGYAIMRPLALAAIAKTIGQ
ncbi:SGNH/GDSL hydrolase family protein [Sphingomonas nostoxanthinifaciens]|uniref:SGNH/GDSL hydrolase family protein n=1 Tax=Sphingomonas nostoxanthinifaciens TaxID=2872652 RepID=UPI001CC1C8A5|nr:SGNH/GDSL hydrolase family protein [Sphingomonas nostoxanthinifaciens]UAK23046.1 SGNH/GDSL hydrolase family protein [Sphingomonas nostoxanthinifaciens]